MATRRASLSLDSFKSILKLEQSRGYTDKAVIGGLDRLLQRWAEALKDTLSDPALAGQLLGISYAKMTPEQRAQWVAQWLSLLDKGDLGRPASPGPIPQQAPAQTVATSPKTTVEKRQPIPPPPGPTLDSSVDKLRGVDIKTSARLAKLGVTTIQDLLYLFPRRHRDYSQVSKIADLAPGQECTIVATVWEAREVKLGRQGSLKATEAVVGDETGNLRVIWFGQPYLARQFHPNSRLALSGRLDLFGADRVLESPEYEVLGRQDTLIHTGRLAPVYPLTEGLTARNLRRIMWQALERWGPLVEEILPPSIQARHQLLPLAEAIRQAHFPDDQRSLDAARRRLAFDELLILQCAVLMRRQDWQGATVGRAVQADPRALSGFLASLPFTLTSAQQRCLGEVLTDMKRGTPPMSRLLQGEVGSGKTVVALAALLGAVTCGYQGSIMAPTELLAEQHFATVDHLVQGLPGPVREPGLLTFYVEPHPQPIAVGLLTSSTRGSIKRQILRRATEGSLDIVIGTHALIEGELQLPRLALAVVDEQHRFGVMQRAALRGKGELTPHMLVMSATPIPRTLALTLYGDLDISTLDELPPGRHKITTRWVRPEKRQAAYGFVRDQVSLGRQAFVVCPLIEESEVVEAKAATEEYQRLAQEVFPDLRLGLLHGRMASREKDRVMQQFRQRELDILVSTPVVEVGIDVPNAAVMMVEGADRFGLAQLHQFRGRVGRGQHKSYCLLLADSPSETARERLSALEQIHDGFKLAEVDLNLRGPGDFFGTRQSGLPTLRMASVSDSELLRQAREEATALVGMDPRLTRPEHRRLAQAVDRFQGQVRVSGEVS